MRIIFMLALLVFFYRANAQPVSADPSLGQVFITTPEDAVLALPPAMPRESVHKLKLPVFNLNNSMAIPAGSTKIKIGLGSKMVLDPAFNLATSNTSAYFNWTAENQGGQVQLTGDQTAPLPAGFDVTAEFQVKGIILGTSTITANFLITNHNNGAVALSDENGANNISAQFYVITESVPVTFTSLDVSTENCAVAVYFTSENEVNLSRYIIEYSTDGINFTAAGQLQARQSRHYQYRFYLSGSVQPSVVYVRIKSVDHDASFQYSWVRALRDLCGNTADGFLLFPNPGTSGHRFITIAKKSGLFSGEYDVTVFNTKGEKVRNHRRNLTGLAEFDCDILLLPAGQYFIRLSPVSAAAAPGGTLKFLKQ